MNAKVKTSLDTHQVDAPQKTRGKDSKETATKAENWKDPKRYMWLLGPALPGIGLAALTGYALAPKRLKALAWTGPALVHGIIPALDRAIGEDKSNPPESAVKTLEQDKYYDRIVKAFIPTQYAMTFMGRLAGQPQEHTARGQDRPDPDRRRHQRGRHQHRP